MNIVAAIRYKQDRRLQMLLFVLSTLVGSRMLYLWDNASFLVIMKQVNTLFGGCTGHSSVRAQCPPLITIWIYTVVQLDLGAAVLSLSLVGCFVWWQDIRVFR